MLQGRCIRDPPWRKERVLLPEEIPAGVGEAGLQAESVSPLSAAIVSASDVINFLTVT